VRQAQCPSVQDKLRSLRSIQGLAPTAWLSSTHNLTP
jgi:hypothetical protein